MNLQKLNPWNWFKHEENDLANDSEIPISRNVSKERAVAETDQNPILKLHREIDQLFDNVFSGFGIPSLRKHFPVRNHMNSDFPNFYRPNIDVSGDEKKYEIDLDVPGLSEPDLSIEVKGDVLLIKGEKEDKKESDDKKYYRMERSYGAFQRTLSLPEDADADAIKANLKDGVLKLEVPRRETEKQDVKHISISS